MLSPWTAPMPHTHIIPTDSLKRSILCPFGQNLVPVSSSAPPRAVVTFAEVPWPPPPNFTASSSLRRAQQSCACLLELPGNTGSQLQPCPCAGESPSTTPRAEANTPRAQTCPVPVLSFTGCSSLCHCQSLDPSGLCSRILPVPGVRNAEEPREGAGKLQPSTSGMLEKGRE